MKIKEMTPEIKHKFGVGRDNCAFIGKDYRKTVIGKPLTKLTPHFSYEIFDDCKFSAVWGGVALDQWNYDDTVTNAFNFKVGNVLEQNYYFIDDKYGDDANFEHEIKFANPGAVTANTLDDGDNRVIEYDIDFENLTFDFQPGLLSGIEANDPRVDLQNSDDNNLLDTQGNVVFHRPDDYIDSISVYTSKKHNKYKTGKAFHIKRAFVTESDETKTYLTQEIDTANKKWRVFVPKTFIQTAKYPFKVGPTFGYTTAGASETNAENILLSYEATGIAGTLDSITAYFYESLQTHNAISGLYDNTGNFVSGTQTAAYTISYPSADWATANTSGSPSISAVTYRIALHASSGGGVCRLLYDSGGTAYHAFETYTGTLPSSPTWYSDSFHLSIYGNVTTGAAGQTYKKPFYFSGRRMAV